jgi:hypothetical protein
MTWMRQPSRQGIALFSVRKEFWRSTTQPYYNDPNKSYFEQLAAGEL